MLENINYNITSIIDILGLVQGLFLGIVLISEFKINKSKALLGCFLFIYSIELLDPILGDLGITKYYPSLLFLPFNFYYLLIPLFYVYVKNISKSRISNRNLIFLFLPGIIEFLFFLSLFIQNSALKLELHDSEKFMVYIDLIIFLSYLYSIYYSIIIVKYINKHKTRVENFYSNTEGKLLLWAKSVIIFLLIYLFLLTFYPFENTIYSNSFFSFVNVIFIFWLGITGIKQKAIFEKSTEVHTETVVKIEDKPTVVNDDLHTKNYNRLIKLMEEDKFFLNPNISLADVSRELKISQRNLSELIHKESQTNFSQFVNYYRVEEAKKLLIDAKNDNLNMLGIAYDSGFNSKASFYSVFKKFTSQTPNNFKNSNL